MHQEQVIGKKRPTYAKRTTVAAQESEPLTWYEWLKQSLIGSGEEKKRKFLNTVRKGDILISKSSMVTGMIGHAAIMATDCWVLEMPGGGATAVSFSSSGRSSSRQNQILEDNNRKILINDWYDEHSVTSSDSIIVYRCPDYNIAEMAADWAYTHYYNESGGESKTIHIRYSLVSPIFEVRDPSYCSKLVLQSYYYGTRASGKQVISLVGMVVNQSIVPTTIPAYFTSSYELTIVFSS